jgi:hypothetical protein
MKIASFLIIDVEGNGERFQELLLQNYVEYNYENYLSSFVLANATNSLKEAVKNLLNQIEPAGLEIPNNYKFNEYIRIKNRINSSIYYQILFTNL